MAEAKLNRTKDIPKETLEDEELLRTWAETNKLYNSHFNMEVKIMAQLLICMRLSKL